MQYYQLSTFLRRWLFDTYVRKFALVCNLQDSYNLQAMSFEHVDLCIILYILTLQFKWGVSNWSIFANKQWTIYLLVYLSCVDPDEMPVLWQFTWICMGVCLIQPVHFYRAQDLSHIMSRCMRFPTMCCVRPAKAQISLRIRTVWSEPSLVAWIFYDCYVTDWR